MSQEPLQDNGLWLYYSLKDPKIVWQIRVITIIVALVTFYTLSALGFPILFQACIGVFFLVPLFGMPDTSSAISAFEKGKECTGTAIWSGDHEDSATTWYALLDLGEDGQWHVELAMAHNALLYPRDDQSLSTIQAWLHPKTGLPELIEIDNKFISVANPYASSHKKNAPG